MRAAPAALARALDTEADRWFLWIPVLFAAGIGVYFWLEREPSPLVAPGAIVLAATLCLLTRRIPALWLASAALLCAALGFADAKLRTWWVSGPTLEDETSATVRGWIEKREPQLPKGYRLTLRVIGIESARPVPDLYRVRITSRFEQAPPTGTPVSIRARLLPIPEPVQPGGFDFAVKAWFDRLGALGFSFAAPEPLADAPDPPAGLRLVAAINRMRSAVHARIEAALPEARSGIVTALITGERGRIPEDTLQALRHSGLAHLLAISGMHMAIMAGALYWLLRAGGAAFPGIALRYPVKKWAAVLALLGGAFYLALSGAAIATQRAFLMMAIIFTAILLDRPAMTLRNVALAACVVLALFPESLFDVSFQMSFAAVTGLVAVYERISRRTPSFAFQSLWWRVAATAGRYMGGIALTTLVASIAVAPFAAFHFHKLAQYGLIANLAAMPVFGLVVMPSAMLALVLMPLGLEAWPLQLMASGLETIVGVAREVSGWSGAVVRVAEMPAVSLLALTVGGLWLCLWQRSWRFAGLAIAAFGLIAATGGERPDILVGREGELLGVRRDSGVLGVLGASRASYSLEQWLRADGDGRPPDAALEKNGARCDELACIAEVEGKTVAFVRHPAALAEECRRADVVIAQIPIERRCPNARVTVGRIDLWAHGAHALYFGRHSIRTETVADARGNRPWSRLLAERRKRGEPGTAYAGEGRENDR